MGKSKDILGTNQYFNYILTQMKPIFQKILILVLIAFNLISSLFLSQKILLTNDCRLLYHYLQSQTNQSLSLPPNAKPQSHRCTTRSLSVTYQSKHIPQFFIRKITSIDSSTYPPKYQIDAISQP